MLIGQCFLNTANDLKGAAPGRGQASSSRSRPCFGCPASIATAQDLAHVGTFELRSDADARLLGEGWVRASARMEKAAGADVDTADMLREFQGFLTADPVVTDRVIEQALEGTHAALNIGSFTRTLLLVHYYIPPLLVYPPPPLLTLILLLLSPAGFGSELASSSGVRGT